MVDRKFETTQWETLSIHRPRPDHAIRCSQDRGWGAACQDVTTGGPWLPEEKNFHINISELKAANLAIQTFTRLKKVNSIHIQIDNTTSLSYLVKMGGTRKKNVDIYCQGDLDISHVQKDHFYGRISSANPSEHQSRLGIPQCSGLIGVETSSRCVQKDMQNLWDTRNRSISIANIPPTTMLHESETRPNMQGGGCFSTELVTPVRVRLPPFQHDREDSQKTNDATESTNNHNPSMGISAMVPFTIGNVSSNSISSPAQNRSLVKPREGTRHPLLQNTPLKLAAWLVSGNAWRQKEFQRGLLTLSPHVEKQEQEIITTQPSRNLVAGVVQNRLIPFNAV